MATRRVLITESLAKAGVELLRRSCDVTVRLKPTPAELVALIKGFDALIVRSGTQVTDEVMSSAGRLVVVGRAGTGVDNIDLEAATRHGVAVVNAPASNSISVAEHTMALMLCLARHIPQANQTMHSGLWEKSHLVGSELRDKVLGIVGLGRVGIAVAARAKAFDMRLLAYDPFIAPERAEAMGVELTDLDGLLTRADYVSLHAPATERTRGLIDASRLAKMKPTACLINCARGELLVEEDLVRALSERHIAGAALDVFAHEPNVSDALRDCPNLLLSPHIGASTQEAQSDAALQVSRQVLDVLEGRPPRYAVNLIALPPEESRFLQPYLDLGSRMGRFYGQIAENNLRRIEVCYAGEVAEHAYAVVTSAVLAGVMSEAGDGAVNVVNAQLAAEQRGLAIGETRSHNAYGFSSMVTLKATTTTQERVISGTVMRGKPHIVAIDGYWVDFVPMGTLLVDEHMDQPGFVGKIGTLLGNANVNISFVQVGRQTKGGWAITVMGVDGPIAPEVLDQVIAMSDIRSVRAVRL